MNPGASIINIANAGNADSQFNGYFDGDVHSLDRCITLQTRKVSSFPEPAHFHPSIEINYLQECDMFYSFSGHEVEVKRHRFCVFWAAHPHRKVKVAGVGKMTNVYVSLSEFLRWSLPSEFVSMLLNGAVLTTKTEQEGDTALANRFAAEVNADDMLWQRLHGREMQARLHRMAMEGWDVVHQPTSNQKTAFVGGRAIQYLEKMLSFVAINYANKISVDEVASAANISSSHALALFNQMLGRSIMSYVKDLRIVHARMLLVETDKKILAIALECGFGSLSTFYPCFQERTGLSPAAFRKLTRYNDQGM